MGFSLTSDGYKRGVPGFFFNEYERGCTVFLLQPEAPGCRRTENRNLPSVRISSPVRSGL